MKIAFLKTNQRDSEIIKKELSNNDLFFLDNLADVPRDTEILSIEHEIKLEQETINSLPLLRLIQTRSTGFNNIDVNFAKEKKILVSNIPSYHPESIAEFTFGLILQMTRKIRQAEEQMAKHFFSNPDLMGCSLSGKTLGVIGTGNIGKKVINIARGFGMNVIGFDNYPDASLFNSNFFNYTNDLNILAENSDIVTLHIPATDKNYHLINKDFLNRMSPESFLVNTARGELINPYHLLESIENNRLKGVALDVLEKEEELSKETTSEITTINKKLIAHPRIITTPHIAYFTKQAKDSLIHLAIESIKSFSSNRPINLVN